MVVGYDFRSITLRLRLSTDLPLSNDRFLRIQKNKTSLVCSRPAEEIQKNGAYLVFGGLAVMAMTGIAVDP